MRLTLHQLNVFATLAEKKSVTKTAEALHMTQPAVSIQIKQLEEYYGIKLVEVIGKKLYITQAGEELARTVHDISARLEHTKMVFANLQGCISGKLRIAAVSTTKYFIPHLLGKFKQLYPKIEIELNITTRQTLIKNLSQNIDDMVIMSQLPEKLPIIAEPILEDELVMAASPNHHLANTKISSFTLLGTEMFLSREPGSGTRLVMEKLFHQYRIKPPIAMELGSNETIKQAVMANIGISLLSKLSIKHELNLKLLSILNIKNLPIRHTWYAVYQKKKSLSPIASKFLEFIKNQHP